MKNLMKLAGIFILCAFLLTACGGGQVSGPVAQKNDSLTILEWSGYETDTYWEPFAAAHPEIQPEYAFFGEDAEALSKDRPGRVADGSNERRA